MGKQHLFWGRAMCIRVKSELLILNLLFLNPHPLGTMPNLRRRMFINRTVFSTLLTSTAIKDSLKKQPAAQPAHFEFLA